jgi:7-keto-8-aminopelargonate synthetase-like enzyme
VTALAGASDLIVSDAANHASLIDGCRLSKATVAVYRHADADAAAAALGRPGTYRRRLLITESLFSMDGDVAPLARLAALAATSDAVMIVDEAHALGVLGPHGRGLCAEAGVDPDVLVGTLGKAFGAAGGFVTGSSSLRAYLVNHARTFVFTTALPPPVAGAARAALALASGPDGDRRRARLQASQSRVVEGLDSRVFATRGPILPVILGTDERALAAANRLRERGLFVPAIRPPTVPEGSARLRVTFSSEHTDDELDALAAGLAEVLS